MGFVGVKIILDDINMDLKFVNFIDLFESLLLYVDYYLILLSFVMFHKWMQLENQQNFKSHFLKNYILYEWKKSFIY